MPRERSCPSRRSTSIPGIAVGTALATGVGAGTAHAAEYGTGPWVKGYTDIFGGILPA